MNSPHSRKITLYIGIILVGLGVVVMPLQGYWGDVISIGLIVIGGGLIGRFNLFGRKY